MGFFTILFLACVQGLAELLPVSSSAHVILAEKMLGLDPTTPTMTLLLVLLHTGTMFAVLVYFWKNWRDHYFQSRERATAFLKQVLLATATTLVLGFILMKLIEKVMLRSIPGAEVEMLFGNLKLVSASLASVGILILAASQKAAPTGEGEKLGARESIWIGLVQGLCLPFRGLSRSGATISTGLMLGLNQRKAEEYSFALAVAITPFVLGKELWRLYRFHLFSGSDHGSMAHLLLPGLMGMVFSFLAGLLALRWLSNWLEKGKWGYFGVYCLGLAALIWLGANR